MLTIDPEFKNLIPPLTPEERVGLEASIAREGCHDPLKVWTDTGILLDGHHRHEICQRLGKPYNTIGLTFPDRGAAIVWAIKNQVDRRNLTDYQKAELALKLEHILRQAARERMLAGRPDPLPNSGQGRVDDELAKIADVGHDTIHRVRYIAEHADEPTKERLRSGETTINAEYTRLKTPGRMGSSVSVKWYTPAKHIEAARRVLGDIDLDPASDREANRTVRAVEFYDEETDGLTQEWPGRVWLNPPYCGLQDLFVEKLVSEYRAGRTRAAIVLVNAYGCERQWFKPLWDFPLCFVEGRISFRRPGEIESDGNNHASAFAYLGRNEDRFIEVFSAFGPVVKRVDVPAAVAVGETTGAIRDGLHP